MAEDPQIGRQAIESQVPVHTNVVLVLDCDTDDYGVFIQRLRRELANHDENRSTLVHDIPAVLPEKALSTPARWMRIKLVSNGHAVTLFIRDDDLYLQGFELETEDEKTKKKKVYELGIQVIDSNTKKERSFHMLGQGSTFLGYGEKYCDMLGKDVMLNFPRLRMGREFAKEAVRLLSTYDQPRPMGEAEAILYVKQTKEALAGLAFMICEGARMVPQHDMVFVAWALNQETLIRQRHVYCCWAWGALSRLLLAGKVKTNKQKRNLDDVKIKSVEEAVKYVRLVRHSKKSAGPPPPPPGGSTGPPPGRGEGPSEQGNNGEGPSEQNKTSGQPSSSRDVGQRGRPLVEVFSVHTYFLTVRTITIFDGRRGQIVYEGDQGQTEDSQYLALTGPYRAISAEEERIAITVEPYSNNGTKLWELECPIPEAASTPVMKSYITPDQGDERQITVSYAVLSDAVEATVKVELEMTGKGEAARDPIDVYGEITARNPTLGGESVVLLRREQARKQSVVCGSPISLELDRSVLAAAADSELVISWKLHASWPGNETTVDFEGEFLVSPLPDRHDVVFSVKIVSPEFYPIEEQSDAAQRAEELWESGRQM